MLAVGFASAVGAFAQGAPVPPGAEAPGYGGDEIETVIVIGEKLRCPDGTMVNTINECPGFIQSWLNRVYRLPWDPITHVIGGDSIPNAPTCGATTVDASCVCGGGKVKVYDDSNDTFHCKTEPAAAGCPKWDQTFDFDPNVWKCMTRPFDADPVDAAERLKNCMGSGVVTKHWHRLESLLVYDPSLPAAGQAPLQHGRWQPRSICGKDQYKPEVKWQVHGGYPLGSCLRTC